MNSDEKFVPKQVRYGKTRNPQVVLEHETHKTIKMLAAEMGVPMKVLVDRILVDYVRQEFPQDVYVPRRQP